MTVLRWTSNQRYQHLLLAVSVLMLIITGLPIKYGQAAWAPYVVAMFGGFGRMFTVHLTFAVLMLISGAYHAAWLAGAVLRRGPTWDMVPTWKDVRDAYHHAGYLLGLRRDRPRYGRYSYLEKFEYLAVIWGVGWCTATRRSSACWPSASGTSSPCTSSLRSSPAAWSG